MAAVDLIETVPHARLILASSFLNERLVDVLDNQGTDVFGAVVEPDQSGLDAATESLVPKPVVVRARRPALAQLRERPAPIVSNGDPQFDAAFRQLLIELRETLKDVYGQRLTFDGEKREPTGTTVEVRQELDIVQELAVGADIESGQTDGDVKINQKMGVVEKRATASGTRLGGNLGKDRP